MGKKGEIKDVRYRRTLRPRLLTTRIPVLTKGSGSSRLLVDSRSSKKSPVSDGDHRMAQVKGQGEQKKPAFKRSRKRKMARRSSEVNHPTFSFELGTLALALVIDWSFSIKTSLQ